MNNARLAIIPALLLSMSACTGSDGQAGAAGPPGPQGEKGGAGAQGAKGENLTATPNVATILPSAAFTGRKQTVTILGSNTAWTSASVASFGVGIKVDSAKVVSPTAIVANLTIDPTAAVGDRDVTITTGATSQLLTKGLSLKLPVEISLVQGTVAQGSVLFLDLKNNDSKENPFDVTRDQNTGEFPNFALDSESAGMTFQSDGVAAKTATFVTFIDADAAVGARSLSVLSGPTSDLVTSSIPAVLPVVARAPKPLAAGIDFNFTATAALGSELVSFTATQAGQTTWTITGPSGATQINPLIALLNPTGGFTGARFVGPGNGATIIQEAGQLSRAVLVDSSGKLTAMKAKATFVAFGSSQATETEPNDAIATAQTVGALPYLMGGATLSTLTDVDLYKVVLTASTRLSLITSAKTTGNVDTRITVLDATGTPIAGAESADRDFYDTLDTAPLDAGTYYVRISNSPEAPAATPTIQYRFLINTL